MKKRGLEDETYVNPIIRQVSLRVYVQRFKTCCSLVMYVCIYVVYVAGSKSFRPDQLFKVTEIKQLCCFST